MWDPNLNNLLRRSFHNIFMEICNGQVCFGVAYAVQGCNERSDASFNILLPEHILHFLICSYFFYVVHVSLLLGIMC